MTVNGFLAHDLPGRHVIVRPGANRMSVFAIGIAARTMWSGSPGCRPAWRSRKRIDPISPRNSLIVSLHSCLLSIYYLVCFGSTIEHFARTDRTGRTAATTRTKIMRYVKGDAQTVSTPGKEGVLYARVSSKEQEKEGFRLRWFIVLRQVRLHGDS